MKKYFYVKDDLSINGLKIKKKTLGFAKENKSQKISIYLINYGRNIEIRKDLLDEIDIQQTGDQHPNKICDRCFRYLPTNFFSNNRIKKDAITKRPSCKDCRKIKDGVSVSNSDKKKWNKKKPKNYELFECPICKKTTIAGISKIVLDHNHHTGKVRGYLCESCNTGIGRFDDNPNVVKNAIKWLKKNN